MASDGPDNDGEGAVATRPGDWSPLGRNSDPTPGDPEVVRRVADLMKRILTHAETADTGINTIKQQSGEGALVGKTAEWLRKQVEENTKNFISQVKTAFGAAEPALRTYATKLAEAQGKADTALANARGMAADDPGLAQQKADAEAAAADVRSAASTLSWALTNAGTVSSPKTACEQFWELFGWLTLLITIVAIFVGGPLGLLAFAMNAALAIKAVIDFAQHKTNALGLALGLLGLLGPSTKPLNALALAKLIWQGGKSLIQGVGRGAVGLFNAGVGFFKAIFSTQVFTGIADIAATLAKTVRTGSLTVIHDIRIADNLAAKGFVALKGFVLVPPLVVAKGIGNGVWSGLKGVYNFGAGVFNGVLNLTKRLGTVISNELGGAKSLRLFLPLNADEIAVLGVGGAFKLGVLGRGLGVPRFAGLEHTFNELSLAAKIGGGARLGEGIVTVSHADTIKVPGYQPAPGVHLPTSMSAFDGGAARAGDNFAFHRLDNISSAGSPGPLASPLDLAGGRPLVDVNTGSLASPSPLPGFQGGSSLAHLDALTPGPGLQGSHSLADLSGLNPSRTGDLTPNATPSTFATGGVVLTGNLTEAGLSAQRSMQLGQPIDNFVSPEIRAALNGNGVHIVGRSDTAVSLNVELPSFGSGPKLLEPPAPVGLGHTPVAREVPVASAPSVNHLLEPPRETGAPVLRNEPIETGRSGPAAPHVDRSALDLIASPKGEGAGAKAVDPGPGGGKGFDGKGLDGSSAAGKGEDLDVKGFDGRGTDGSGRTIDDAGQPGRAPEPERIALRPEPKPGQDPLRTDSLQLSPEQATALALHQQSVLHLDQARQVRAAGSDSGAIGRFRAERNVSVAEALVRKSEARLKATGVDPARLGDDLGESALGRSKWSQGEVEAELGPLRNLRKPASQWPGNVKTWYRAEATELHAKLVQDVGRIGPELHALPGNPVGERIAQFRGALDDLRERAAGLDTFHRQDAFRSAASTPVAPGLQTAKDAALVLARNEFADAWAKAAQAPSPGAARSGLIRDLNTDLPKLTESLQQAAKPVDELRPPGSGHPKADGPWQGLKQHLTVELAAIERRGGPDAAALKAELLDDGGRLINVLDRGAATVDAGRRVFNELHGSAFRPGPGSDLTWSQFNRLREEYAQSWARSQPDGSFGTIPTRDFPEWAAARDGASVGVRSGDWMDPFAGAGGKHFVTHHEFEARRFQAGGEWHTDLTVKVSLTDASKFGPGAQDRVWSAVTAGVEKFLNTAKNGHAYRLPNGDHLHITVQRVPPGSGEHLPVRIVDRDTAPMDQRTWWSDADPATYSHEVSHQLGLRDESWAGIANRTDVKGSIAGDFRSAPGSDLKNLTEAERAEFDALVPGGLRGRHLQLIERQLGEIGPGGGYHGDFGAPPVPGAAPRAPTPTPAQLAREAALSATFQTNIGHSHPGAQAFQPRTLDRIEAAMRNVPIEHLRSNPELRAIHLTESRSPESRYSAQDQAIHIVLPSLGGVRIPEKLYASLNRASGWQRYFMDVGALAGMDGVGVGFDALARLVHNHRHVMAGVSDVLANGSLLKWTVRHEIGHAVDERIGWKLFDAGDQRFGGWQFHNASEELHPLAEGLLRGAGADSTHADWNQLVRALTDRLDFPKLNRLLDDPAELAEVKRQLEQLPALFGSAPRDLHLRLLEQLRPATGMGLDLDGVRYLFDRNGWRTVADGRPLAGPSVPGVAQVLVQRLGLSGDWVGGFTDDLARAIHPEAYRPGGPASLDALGAAHPDLTPAQLNQLKSFVDLAHRQPWTFDSGMAAQLTVNGRIYQVDHYGNWVSYDAAARNPANALSNYQFSNPRGVLRRDLRGRASTPTPAWTRTCPRTSGPTSTPTCPGAGRRSRRTRTPGRRGRRRPAWAGPRTARRPPPSRRPRPRRHHPGRRPARGRPHAPSQHLTPVDRTSYGPNAPAPSPSVGPGLHEINGIDEISGIGAGGSRPSTPSSEDRYEQWLDSLPLAERHNLANEARLAYQAEFRALAGGTPPEPGAAHLLDLGRTLQEQGSRAARALAGDLARADLGIHGRPGLFGGAPAAWAPVPHRLAEDLLVQRYQFLPADANAPLPERYVPAGTSVSAGKELFVREQDLARTGADGPPSADPGSYAGVQLYARSGNRVVPVTVDTVERGHLLENAFRNLNVPWDPKATPSWGNPFGRFDEGRSVRLLWGDPAAAPARGADGLVLKHPKVDLFGPNHLDPDGGFPATITDGGQVWHRQPGPHGEFALYEEALPPPAARTPTRPELAWVNDQLPLSLRSKPLLPQPSWSTPSDAAALEAVGSRRILSQTR